MPQQFTTPGSVSDFAGFETTWSDEVAKLVAKFPDHPRFLNPSREPAPTDLTPAELSWGAFPKKLANKPSPEKWRTAEDRGRQEEYCEWAALKSDDGNLLKAFFTTEVPSYYKKLAATSPETLVALYQKHVDSSIQESDLFDGGTYDPVNRWNLAGAMHMIQGANTLDAAVTLVAESTVVRFRDDVTVTNPNDLIRCGVNADPNRNSDPLIVGEVNALARRGASVGLADPFGLYIAGLRTEGWTIPAPFTIDDFWTVERGSQGHAVRAVLAPPAGEDVTLADIQVDGKPLTSASQVAEHLSIKIVGLAADFGGSVDRRPCQQNDGLESLDEDGEVANTRLAG